MLRPRVLALMVFLGCALGACAAPRPAATSAAPSAGDHPLVTAGGRCTNGVCRCRQTDELGNTIGEPVSGPDLDTAAPGMKRFELRTGRGNDAVSITVEGAGTLRKTGESVEPSCGYIDLAPGDHRVRAHVQAPAHAAASPRILVYEHGARTGSWYESFAMSCGVEATCTRQELEDNAAMMKHPRGIFDPCGSVEVRSIHYDAQRDGEDRVTALDLDFVLHVEKFEPRFPRGGTCKGLSTE